MTSCTHSFHPGRSLVAGAALLTLVGGCAPDPPPPPPAPVSPSAPANVDEGIYGDRAEIPLDSSYAADEASLERNFYFIFDGSGSMGRETGSDCRGDQRFSNKIEGARWAVRDFLSKIPNDVNIGLFVFDKNGRDERVALGRNNRDAFVSAINTVQVGGGTPLAPAIEYGTRQLIEQYKRQLGYGEFRLVVVTDGQADEIPRAATFAARFGMPIYAIGLCIGEDHPLRQHAVSYRAADNFADLSRGLEETLAELPSFDVTEFSVE